MAGGGARVEPRGYALRGRVTTRFEPHPPGQSGWPDGLVVVDAAGAIAALGPSDEVTLPSDVLVIGESGAVVTPGIVDAHVHLAFGSPDQVLAGGVVAVRDLGAPEHQARSWRNLDAPLVAVAGPLLTAPGGYPSRSWGAGGFAAGVDWPAAAAVEVRRLCRDADLPADRPGVDVVKLALEPAGGAPVPDLEVARAVVAAAHDEGRAVTCHALTGAMVARALDAGVDELCHTPVEELSSGLIRRIADAGIPVISTLETLISDAASDVAAGPTSPTSPTSPVARNAARLVAAGVPLVYGTDLGNAGTRPGADPRELDRLVAAGLGRIGALAAATMGAAQVAGLAGRGLGELRVGQPVAALVLDDDPTVNFALLQNPRAVAVGRRVLTR